VLGLKHTRPSCGPTPPLPDLHSVQVASTAIEQDGTSPVKGSSTSPAAAAAAAAAATVPSSSTSAENCYAVAAINAAHVLVLQQKHATALQILEPLFGRVESINGGAALHLCLLLFEVYLAAHQHTKMAAVISYLETAFGLVPEGGQFTRSSGVGASLGSGGGGAEDGSGGLDGGAGGSREGTSACPDGGGSSSRTKDGSAAADQAVNQHEEEQQQQAGADSTAAADGSSDRMGGTAAAAASQAAASVAAGPVDERRALQLPKASRVTSPLMDLVRPLLEARSSSPECMPDLNVILRLLRAQLALAARHPKAAKRDVRALLVGLPRSEAVLMLKAQLEAGRGQPRKALKTLGPVLAPHGPSSSTAADTAGAGGGSSDSTSGSGSGSALLRPAARIALLNNLGVLHHQFGKHQLAAVYLSRALSESAQRQPGATSPAAMPDPSSTPSAAAAAGGGGGGGGGGGVLTSSSKCSGSAADVQQGQFNGLWSDHSFALQYNLGLQHLMLRNWEAALCCFDAAGQRFYMQPWLWLRMAEANVGLHCQHAKQQQRQARRRQQQAAAGSSSTEGAAEHPLLDGVAGYGARRRLLLPAGRALNAATASKLAAASDHLWHEGHLGAALLQLQTALALLQECKAEAAKDAEEAAAATAAALGAPSANGGLSGGNGSQQGEGGSGGGAGGSSGGARGADEGGSPTAASASGGGAGSVGAGGAASRMVFSDAPPIDELETVGQTIWSNLAYVHLLRDDPVPALAAAQQLLACSGLSAQQHHLGSCYAAEALCMLGRPEEAAPQLLVHLSLFHGGGAGVGAEPVGAAAAGQGSGGGVGSPGLAASAAAEGAGGPAPSISIKSDDDTAAARESYPLGNAAAAAALSGPSARAATLSNLAAVAAMRGELGSAQTMARQALATAAESGGDGPGGGLGGAGSRASAEAGSAAAAAQLLLVYCELKRGDVAAALTLLRDTSGLPV